MFKKKLDKLLSSESHTILEDIEDPILTKGEMIHLISNIIK